MKRYSLIVVSILLAALFIVLSNNLAPKFEQIELGYRDGSVVNLSEKSDESHLASHFLLHGYASCKEDADLMAKHIVATFDEGNSLPNLYALNRRVWQIPVSSIDSLCLDNGSESQLKQKAEWSKVDLGQDSISLQYIVDSSLVSERQFSNAYKSSIKVAVSRSCKNDTLPLLKRLFDTRKLPVVGVTVRLKHHYLDSMGQAADSVMTYLKTDSRGVVVFNGLDPSYSYSVLPIRVGYEYGSPKGTVGGTLKDVMDDDEYLCSFNENEHKLRMFSNITLKQAKEESTMTIRTPEQYKGDILLYLVLFYGVWWGLYLLIKLKRMSIDVTMLSILMFMTGLSLLVMFSINDPLTDTMLGADMAGGIVCGVAVIALLQFVDFVKLYKGGYKIGFDIPVEFVKWIFKPWRVKIAYLTQNMRSSKNVFLKFFSLILILLLIPLLILDPLFQLRRWNVEDTFVGKLPKGSGYLALAIFLTLLLFSPLGAQVGGMTVNLNLGFILFQPSEIAKYLVILFMAAFFCQNADAIVRYSEPGNTELFGKKVKMLVGIIIGFGILMFLYFVLGDMGPALVLAFTFILLYSIIKSKVDLRGVTPENKYRKIFTCDIAMLFYGVVSFVLFLFIGDMFGGEYGMLILAIVWGVVWILTGLQYKRQIFETPILFNMIVSMFLFGGFLFKDSTITPLAKVADRLESRMEMCTNTWGNLGLDGSVCDAGENTQVADGLWALSTGGTWGQGLGAGNPHLIPAFHTDMILESIGEQMGFVAIVIIIVLLSMLLRRAVVAGYHTSHPYAFYLTTGIAVVTIVQFLIISLGSTGIIPLTGVTVPFFSYGRVSMILNLAAFGIILSLSADGKSGKESVQTSNQQKVKRDNIAAYSYPVALVSLLCIVIMIGVLSVFWNYQFWSRNSTLIRPVYVNNVNGEPIVVYNPRINLLTEAMHAGNIYDRNGVLLATSDRSALKKDWQLYSSLNLDVDTLKPYRRYYPFGNHLFFMLGDYNSKLFFTYDEESPVGYMAEAQHLSKLRGYENRLIDEETNEPIKVDLTSNEYRANRFMGANSVIERRGIVLRDYSRLIPYLKAGINSNKVQRVNERDQYLWEIEPEDITLTIDAKLQTLLQNGIEEHVTLKRKGDRTHKAVWGDERNKMRISVVVLNARSGDLLASANYPLPDYERLATIPDNVKYYSDNAKDLEWMAYTDMDLGLSYYTNPGSTAKVMSAMAGFMRLGTGVASPKYNYYVQQYQTVGTEPTGVVSIKKAITHSSNCYFINLVNRYDLYGALDTVYANMGIRINMVKPYTLKYDSRDHEERWREGMQELSTGAVERYEKYIADSLAGKREWMKKHNAWLWAWGQGTLDATPLSMARVASTVVNGGVMAQTRYLNTDPIKSVTILDDDEAKLLESFMVEENHQQLYKSNPNTGAKTGTPERELRDAQGRLVDLKGKPTKNLPNDAWYISFWKSHDVTVAGNKKVKSEPLAIAVRMERTGAAMSGDARELTENIVFKVLKELNYIE